MRNGTEALDRLIRNTINNMAALTQTCPDDLAMNDIPDCGALRYGYPVKLVVAKPAHAIGVAGTTPTAAELELAVAASGDSHAIVIGEFANGATSNEITSRSGDDTVRGLVEVDSVTQSLQGKLVSLDETVRTDLAELNINRQLRVWVITNTNYCFGGTKGYLAAAFFPPVELLGRGNGYQIDLSNITWDHDIEADNVAAQDAAYADLDNTP